MIRTNVFAAGLGVALIAAPAAACDLRATTTPAPSFTPERRSKHAAQLAALRPPVDVVLLGDSLLALWPANQLRAAFPQKIVANLAVGGDRVQNALWKIEQPELATISPGAAVVLAGTNNLWAGDSGCAIEAGVERIALKARALWPQARVYLIEMTPRGPDYAFRNDERLSANLRLAKFALSQSNVAAVDIDAEMTCEFTHPCANYLSDGLHFSRDGYAVLAKSLDTAMRAR